MLRKQIYTGVKYLAVMVILTGIIYPGFVTIVADIFFSSKANGSLVEKDGVVLGSELIGQNFESQEYFRSRPSAIGYNPLPSGGSNLSHLNPVLRNSIAKRKQDFVQSNNLQEMQEVPAEMLSSSASGLDPHISPDAALMQVERIAAARGMNEEQKGKLLNIINDLTEKPQFSLLGESRINVFRLNLMLDCIK